MSFTCLAFEYDGITYNIVSESEKTVEVGSNVHNKTTITGCLVIPESVVYNGVSYTVTSIQDYAFTDCDRLTQVEIPNSVTSVGKGAFTFCGALYSAVIGESVNTIGDYAFYYCTRLTNIEIPNTVTSIGSSLFSYCYFLTNVVIGDSVDSIGDFTFMGCSNLTNVVIGNSVKSIGEGAFKDCKSLTSIDLPHSVETIGNEAFMGCRGLTCLEFPDSITSIGERVINECYDLTTIYLGEKVKSIGSEAFESSFIEKIVVAAKVPPIASINIFNDSTYSYANLFVPASSLTAYETTAPWSSFYIFRPLEESGVDEIDAGASEHLPDVFDSSGRLVKRQASPSDINALSPGLYIVDGQKILVK